MKEKRKRGRPRKYADDAERVRAFRERHSGSRLDIYISDQASGNLKALEKAWDCSASGVIERLLIETKTNRRYQDIVRPEPPGPIE